MALPPSFETVFKNLGFGFYPWFALLPLALARLIEDLARARRGRRTRRPRRLRPARPSPQMLLLVVAAAAYVVTTFWLAYMGTARYPALPWLALAVGVVFTMSCEARGPCIASGGWWRWAWSSRSSRTSTWSPTALAFSHLLTPGQVPGRALHQDPHARLRHRARSVLLPGPGRHARRDRRATSRPRLGALANKLGGALNA